jgi:nucleotide-binding universal stress UspA family protein
VVVGVDGSAANWSAVQWAALEASRRGWPLVLVGAESGSPAAEGASDALEEVRRQLVGTVDTVLTHAATGEPSHALVRTTDERDLLVVGRRSGHPVTRTVLGSTSTAVVGRCRGPVVVVPEGWSVHEHVEEPVVAGVEARRDPQVLEAAFARASELRAPVTVVCSWADGPPHPGAGRDVLDAAEAAEERLDDLLLEWRRRYPAVTVRAESHALSAAVALLGYTAGAQLLVLGRRTGSQHPGGLSLGSTTRRVLHHATCPVAVVPPATRSETEDVELDDTDAPEP